MSFVYFIQAGEDGPIKIGLAARPEHRLRGLQTAHYEILHLRLALHGNEQDEARLHRQFRDCRLVGEWFAPTERLLELISRLRAVQDDAARSDLESWFLHGPPEDPIADICDECGYAMQGELSERGSRHCYACLMEVPE